MPARSDPREPDPAPATGGLGTIRTAPAAPAAGPAVLVGHRAGVARVAQPSAPRPTRDRGGLAPPGLEAIPALEVSGSWARPRPDSRGRRGSAGSRRAGPACRLASRVQRRPSPLRPGERDPRGVRPSGSSSPGGRMAPGSTSGARPQRLASSHRIWTGSGGAGHPAMPPERRTGRAARTPPPDAPPGRERRRVRPGPRPEKGRPRCCHRGLPFSSLLPLPFLAGPAGPASAKRARERLRVARQVPARGCTTRASMPRPHCSRTDSLRTY